MKKLLFSACLLLSIHISQASTAYFDPKDEYGYNIGRHGHSYNLKKAPQDYKELEQEKNKHKFSLLKMAPSIKLFYETDLAIFITSIKNQKNLGACTGFVISYAVQIVQMCQNIKNYLELSPAFVYKIELLTQGCLGRDVGSTILCAISTLCNYYGICPEKYDPYTDNIHNYTKRPTNAQYLAALNYTDTDTISILSIPQDRDHFLSVLNAKCPIILGIDVYEGFESDTTAKTGVGTLPDKTKESLLGGHAVCMIGSGYDKNHNFVYYFVNSWGPDWGMEKTIFNAKKSKGFFSLPAQYIEDPKLGFASEFYAVRTISLKKKI
ncbi:MAG: C1 family peptidase [Janthinobacterium lividum]